MSHTNLIQKSLDFLPMGVIILNLDRRIIYVNESIIRLFGFAKNDLMGELCDEKLLLEPAIIAHSLPGDSNEFKDWFILTKPNREKNTVQKVEVQLYDDSNALSGYMISLLDMSLEQHYIKKLDRARSQAEEAANIKTNFLANMSHELRTPLNAILGMSELSQELSNSREQKEYLSILKTSAENLHQLISSLLEYVKIESGQANLALRSFNLYNFIENIAATFALPVHAKSLHFSLLIPPELDIEIIGDETRLRQVVVNLLTNAIKFTDHGELTVSLRLLENKEANSVQIEWTVSDTGIGIPIQHISKIFDPFVQVDGSSTRNAGGTGIGLSITKGLVELMSGSITVHSMEGKGSKFTFTTIFKRANIEKSGAQNQIDLSSIEILVYSPSQHYFESLRPWFEISKIRYKHISTFSDLVQYLENCSKDPLVIIQGNKEIAIEMCDEANQSKLTAIRGRRQIISLNILRQTERYWRTAGFKYEILSEPLKPKKLISLIQMLEAEYQTQIEREESANYKSPNPINILYLEDEILTAAAQKNLLERAGHTVVHVESGKEVFPALMKNTFDIVILDIETPDMNGFEVATGLRDGQAGEKYKNIPLIALTAHSTPNDIKHAEMVGINAFLAKPFFPQSLLYTIDRILSDKIPEQKYVKEEDSLEIPPILLSHIDQEAIQSIIALLKHGKINDAEARLISGREFESMNGNVVLASDLLKVLFKVRSGQIEEGILLLTRLLNVSESK